MPLIPLKQLYPDPRNANVCDTEVLAKLEHNIARTKLCPPLIVRPHPDHPKAYMILDGHHRKIVLEKLGWTSVECQVWEISDAEAQVTLATLNRLRGTDDLRKRAQLIESLTQTFPIHTLAEMLPETTTQIEDMLTLLRQNFEELEQKAKAQMEAERASLPVPFSCMIPAADFPLVEEALAAFQEKKNKGKADRGAALVSLCRFAKQNLPGESCNEAS